MPSTGRSRLYAPMLRCPASELDSPTTWHYTDTPDAVAGRIACGTYQDKPGVTWTKNDDLVLGDTMGDNLEALHGWWLKLRLIGRPPRPKNLQESFKGAVRL